MKKRIGCVVVAFILLLCIVMPLQAKDKAESEEKQAMPKEELGGFCIVYGNNDKVSYANQGSGITENSVFEMASNGKVITAYVALQMVEEGILDLDEKIAPYLDSRLLTKDHKMSEITVRELLCHTAGFSPSFELGVDKKIYTQPGEQFRYSGVGYIYLQNVIENASNMTMQEAASHYVFEPLHMTNSTFEGAKTVTPMMKLSTAVLYAMAMFLLSFIILLPITLIIGKCTKNKLYSMRMGFVISLIIASVVNVYFLLFIFVSKTLFLFGIYLLLVGVALWGCRHTKKWFWFVMPIITVLTLLIAFCIPVSIPVTNEVIPRKANCAYTLKSTGEDMGIFCRELMNQYQEEDSEVHKMFDEAVRIDEKNAWGLGIAIEQEADTTTYWHSGFNPGFTSLLVLKPSENQYIVVLTNSDSGYDFARYTAQNYLHTEAKWEIKR